MATTTAGWHLTRQHLVAPLCDTCHTNYMGGYALAYYDTTAQATAELIADGWWITAARMQCPGCVENHTAPPTTPTTDAQRWQHLRGWSVACHDCGTSRVEDLPWDPEEEVTHPVWDTPVQAAQDLNNTDWTLSDRTRCPDCTLAHQCATTGHDWYMADLRADVQVGLEQCLRCRTTRLVGATRS